jgi:3-hydroxyacyl-CoA dehydrogenase / enoyl-CoA hydratase / 3-hydroxybutyryl-CoA epimerase
MSDNTIRWDLDADGIVTLTLDDPGRSANTMTDDFRASLTGAIDRLEAEKDTVSGVIITSAKKSFFAGGNLDLLQQVTEANAAEFAAGAGKLLSDFRRLEKLGKPTVAALNGAALGGGLEIALACNRRIALDTPRAQFGLPEVTFGLLPGGGGVTRIIRLLGITNGLTKVLLKGTRYPAAEAARVGIVDELAATPEDLLDKARAWIKANPQTQQPWDAVGYRMPGGEPPVQNVAGFLAGLPGNLRKEVKGAPLPAPHHILCAAVEGATVDFDTALKIEGRYFVNLVTGQTAKNMIQAFWFDLNSINGGGSRPAGYPPRPAKKVAVIGAGMMGAGIAYVSARAGIDVVLKDVSPGAAANGKDYSRKLLGKAVARGSMDQAEADKVLDRITPTADYAGLAGCDLVVEAVFEEQSLKVDVFGETEKVVAPDALLASNTSSLPITSLADGVARKTDFIGLHFFSPVDKMPLLEIIRGEQTSDATLARALDFAAQVKKVPIVVNDSRGFFTSRVIRTLLDEGLAMLAEGIAPATIEQATTQAGYPVGVLQLADELNLGLYLKIRDEAREAAGDSYVAHPAEAVAETMAELGRPGRLRRAGFFDYDESGKRLRLWPGLAEVFPVKVDPSQVDLRELQERMLVIEAVEAARCVEEGVIAKTADANIGSIMGIGYPSWTGGVLQYINGYPGGIPAFIARAEEFAAKHGPRFEPNLLLREKAGNGEAF